MRHALDLDDAVVEVDQHHAVGDDALAADRDVLEAPRPASGLELASGGGYDVAVIDLMLPKLDGLSLIQALRPYVLSMSPCVTTGNDTAAYLGTRRYDVTADIRSGQRDTGQRDTMRLDRVDERIISILGADARMSFAEIGGQVGLSPSAVKRRVDRLVESGAVRGFTVVVEPQAVGWTTEAFIELYCRARTSPGEIRSGLAGYAGACARGLGRAGKRDPRSQILA
jgi:CheY-like chemotaxis protein